MLELILFPQKRWFLKILLNRYDIYSDINKKSIEMYYLSACFIGHTIPTGVPECLFFSDLLRVIFLKISIEHSSN